MRKLHYISLPMGIYRFNFTQFLTMIENSMAHHLCNSYGILIREIYSFDEVGMGQLSVRYLCVFVVDLDINRYLLKQQTIPISLLIKHLSHNSPQPLIIIKLPNIYPQFGPHHSVHSLRPVQSNTYVSLLECVNENCLIIN